MSQLFIEENKDLLLLSGYLLLGLIVFIIYWYIEEPDSYSSLIGAFIITMLLSIFIVITYILFRIITFIEDINCKPPKLKELFKSKKY